MATRYSEKERGPNTRFVTRPTGYRVSRRNSRRKVDPDRITWDACNGMFGGPGGFGTLITYMSKVDGVTGDAEFGLGQNDWTMFEIDCGYEPGDDCPPTFSPLP